MDDQESEQNLMIAELLNALKRECQKRSLLCLNNRYIDVYNTLHSLVYRKAILSLPINGEARDSDPDCLPDGNEGNSGIFGQEDLLRRDI